MKNPLVLGVDVGGTHITVALVEAMSGMVLTHAVQREMIDSKGEKAEILTAWCTVMKSVLAHASTEILGIGIAMPGPFDYENGISLIEEQDKFRSLYQVNLKDELAERLAISPSDIRFINDAASFLQGEMYSGAAKGYSNAVGLTLGTGLGSAIAINGQARDAALWRASFLSGIAEDYFSTRWFVGKYEALTGCKIKGVKELAALAKQDPHAKQIFNEFGRGLAHFLADFIKANQVEIVVLGGNIAQAYPLFESQLWSGLSAYQIDLPIKVAQLNEQATLIGAASLWRI